MNVLNIMEKKFHVYLYITILSIFLADFKIYAILFGVGIVYFLYALFSKKIRLKNLSWQKYMFVFICWALINTFMNIGMNGLDYKSILKLTLNLSFIISISALIESKCYKVNLKSIVRILEVIILLNFIQIAWIYIDGGLLLQFLDGSLTQSSDSAYIVGSYNNLIGGANKNIWASKFTLIYLVYIYMITSTMVNLKKIEKNINILFGIVVILLLLSRTSQLAILAPILFLGIYNFKNIESKYKKIIVPIIVVFGIFGLVIFFKKFFHIKFDMSDGGFTRLYIWKESIKEIFQSNFLFGNGIGSSGVFVKGTLMRSESNLHNVLINTLFELGIIGMSIYSLAIISFVRRTFIRKDILENILIFGIPISIIFNLQYLGYDNDMVIFAVLICIFNSYKKNDINNTNISSSL